jgi:hypothetical protein
MISNNLAADLQIVGRSRQAKGKGEVVANSQFLARYNENALRGQVLGGTTDRVPVNFQSGICQENTAGILTQIGGVVFFSGLVFHDVRP